jgi:hypothetical protein
MEREGRKLKKVAPGDRRRMSDGRNAYRKMTDEQRDEFLRWIADEADHVACTALYEHFRAFDRKAGKS